MKTNLAILSLACALGFEGVRASAQPAELHRITAISLTPEGRPLLTLAGGAGSDPPP